MSIQAAEELVPRLVFAAAAWQKMMMYVTLCPEEINGYGVVDRIGDDVLYVSDVFILDQVVSSVSVVSDAAALAAYASEMIAAGDDPSCIRLQWHSHVNMPAYFSATDLENITSYGNGSCEWMTHIVVNKRGEYQARLDVYASFHLFAPLVCELAVETDDAMQRGCADDIRRHVRRQQVFRKTVVQPDTANTEVSVSHPVEDVVISGGGAM